MKRAFKLVLSLSMTVLFSWYAFRDTDWASQWASMRAANFWWVLPYVGFTLLVHLFRTLRWGALLSGLEKVPFRKLNEASGIGFMMLIILPLRLGEFARPFLIAQRSGIRRSPAMTTVVLERIVDGLAVATLLRVLMTFIPKDAPGYALVLVAGNAMFLIFAGGLAFLLFAVWQRERAVRLIRLLAEPVSKGVAAEVGRVVDSFVGAVKQLPRGPEIAKFFVYTVLYWGVNGAGMMVLSFAFDAPAAGAEEPLRLTLFQAYMVMCTLVVGVMIPSAPGMVGTFQAGVKFGLALFLPAALVNSKGIAYANVLWLCQTLQQVILGLILLSTSQLTFREIAGSLSKEQQRQNAPEGALPSRAANS